MYARPETGPRQMYRPQKDMDFINKASARCPQFRILGVPGRELCSCRLEKRSPDDSYTVMGEAGGAARRGEKGRPGRRFEEVRRARCQGEYCAKPGGKKGIKRAYEKLYFHTPDS